jgi:hypothetical protein
MKKKFYAQGFESFYKFKIITTEKLSFYSRIMVQFPNNFSPKLNREGTLECYINIGFPTEPNNLG